MSEYIIVNKTGKFWSGHKWVTEYPNARIYNTISRAREVCRKMWFDTEIIKDYGTDTQSSFYGDSGI